MAKKIRVRMHCPFCNRSTVHEMQTLDEQKTCLCLVCRGVPREQEDPALRQLNRDIRAYDRFSRAMDIYRSWIIPRW